MRHLKAYRKLNRTSSHRSLMLRNLVTSLFEHERVETTLMKAKEARRIAERMITLGKRGTLHARRQAASVLMKKSVVKKLFDEIAPKYEKRAGGYTRILRVGYRKGDGAPLAFLELVEEEVTVKKKSKKKETKRAPRKAAPNKKEKVASKKEVVHVEEPVTAASEEKTAKKPGGNKSKETPEKVSSEEEAKKGADESSGETSGLEKVKKEDSGETSEE